MTARATRAGCERRWRLRCLEAAVLRLRQFTADASHELRTPLSVLNVQAQSALASGGFDPEAASLIKSQLEEIDRLALMVEDLLTLSRLESPAVERASVDVADLVLESVEQFRAIAESKGVDLNVTKVEPSVITGDRSQLRRLVSNLLDNALEHTERGGSVSVELGRSEDILRLIVADDGRGISASDIPRIFERFYRADRSRSRRTGGAGLGLAIVKCVVEFHGGRVTVESELGKGSSFVVELPSSERLYEAGAQRSRKSSRARLRRRRLFLEADSTAGSATRHGPFWTGGRGGSSRGSGDLA